MSLICDKLFYDHSATSSANAMTSAEVPYIIIGTNDIVEAVNHLKTQAPATFEGCALDSISVTERTGHNVIKLKANYKSSSSSGGSSSGSEDINPITKFSFDTSGGTANRKTAIQTLSSQDAPDLGDGINWDGEQFNGVDVVVANIVENYTVTIATHEFISTDYKRTLAELTGTINMNPFKGWEQGEVLFLGVSVSGSLNDETLDVTFKFAISPNKPTVEIDGITVHEKEGWDYVWGFYENVYDQNLKKKIPKLKHLYNSKVYEWGDFGRLGFGD